MDNWHMVAISGATLLRTTHSSSSHNLGSRGKRRSTMVSYPTSCATSEIMETWTNLIKATDADVYWHTRSMFDNPSSMMRSALVNTLGLVLPPVLCRRLIF